MIYAQNISFSITNRRSNGVKDLFEKNNSESKRIHGKRRFRAKAWIIMVLSGKPPRRLCVKVKLLFNDLVSFSFRHQIVYTFGIGTQVNRSILFSC